MTVLAIDTSTELLSVCLSHDGRYVEINRKQGLKHASILMPLILTLFKDMDVDKRSVDLIVCAKGPGSFTGLRIGISTAKGLAYGLDCPLKLVPTLDAMAYGVRFFPGTIMPIIDARKQRYYSCLYREGKKTSDYLDMPIEKVLEHAASQDKVLFTGPDAAVIDTSGNDTWFLDPLHSHTTSLSVALLGRELFEHEGPDPEEAGPLYLRKSEAEAAREDS